MPSIKEVARAAGVSVTTVSFVLNNKGNISDETRQRVLNVIADLDYTPSAHARNLRDNQARVVGYAWDKNRDRFNPVLDNFLYEMLRLCEQAGRNLLLFSNDAEIGLEPYRSLIDSRRVDGFILSHTRQNDPRFEYLYNAHIPFAAFGRSNSPIDELVAWVDVDGSAGTAATTQHLMEQGHERIAFIGWPVGSVSGDRRHAGYVTTTQQAGLPQPETYVVRATNDSASGYQAAQTLLSLPTPPTAIVCVSDVIALGVLRYMMESGCRVAVTGFDDTPIAEFSYPALTSVRQPIAQVAELLVEMLFLQLDDRDFIAPHHLLKPELVVRASSLG